MLLTMDAGRTIDLAVLGCVHGRAAQHVFCYVQLTRAFMAMPHNESQFTVEWRRRSILVQLLTVLAAHMRTNVC